MPPEAASCSSARSSGPGYWLLRIVSSEAALGSMHWAVGPILGGGAYRQEHGVIKLICDYLRMGSTSDA
jgi:hypothetical protein